MILIGIDPGYDRCGVAVIEHTPSQTTLVYSTCITSSRSDAFSDRIFFIIQELEKIIDKYQPQEAAIEKLFFSKNTKTALQVAEMVGVFRFIFTKHSISLSEYQPSHVKIAITGAGNSDKKSIKIMLPKLINITVLKSTLDDELDAVAVGLTHALHRHYPQAI